MYVGSAMTVAVALISFVGSFVHGSEAMMAIANIVAAGAGGRRAADHGNRHFLHRAETLRLPPTIESIINGGALQRPSTMLCTTLLNPNLCQISVYLCSKRIL